MWPKVLIEQFERKLTASTVLMYVDHQFIFIIEQY